MVKLIALFRPPADPGAFDRHYFDVHLPRLRAIPGIRKVEVTRITATHIGDQKYHLMAELYYPSEDAMDAANASPEGVAAARDMLAFAPDIITLISGDVQ